MYECISYIHTCVVNTVQPKSMCICKHMSYIHTKKTKHTNLCWLIKTQGIKVCVFVCVRVTITMWSMYFHVKAVYANTIQHPHTHTYHYGWAHWRLLEIRHDILLHRRSIATLLVHKYILGWHLYNHDVFLCCSSLVPSTCCLIKISLK